jgi:hypothetical protein
MFTALQVNFFEETFSTYSFVYLFVCLFYSYIVSISREIMQKRFTEIFQIIFLRCDWTTFSLIAQFFVLFVFISLSQDDFITMSFSLKIFCVF